MKSVFGKIMLIPKDLRTSQSLCQRVICFLLLNIFTYQSEITPLNYAKKIFYYKITLCEKLRYKSIKQEPITFRLQLSV